MATDAQRQMFNPQPSDFSEQRASLLREWYRKGQRAFRRSLAYAWTTEQGQTAYLNDELQGLDEVQRDGMLMGWQSDAYAWEHCMPFSVEGTDSVKESDIG